MRTIQLQRPLLSIDTETTGTDPATARVIEIGYVQLAPDGTRTASRLRINPGVPIPAEATAVHGITDADVASAPTFARVAAAVARRMTDVDLTGYNLRVFDLPLLRAEFARAGVAWPCENARVIDSFAIYRTRERYTLGNAVKFYCGRTLQDAHSAQADAEAALDVLLGQLARYDDLPLDVAALDPASGGRQPDWATECGKIRWDADGHAVLAFSKHNGRRLVDIAKAEPGFLRWMQDPKQTFGDDVRKLASKALFGGTPRRTDGGTPPSRGEAFGGDDL